MKIDLSVPVRVRVSNFFCVGEAQFSNQFLAYFEAG